jgi:hypothetical protein
MADWVSAREFPSREQRVNVNMPASVEVSSGRTVLARIVDLSANGFRLVSEEPLQPGQRVEVASRKNASEGRICWVNGSEAGGVFLDRPLLSNRSISRDQR